MIFLFFTPAVLADPDCPESKPSQNEATTPAPSTSPQTEGASKEPSTTKDQIGLTLDPSTAIPDQPIVEEKNPDRKRLLDKIFEAKTREVDIQVRLDELARLQKDYDERIEKIFDENQKLLKELDVVIKKKEQTSIFRSLAPLDKESNRIWRELDINIEKREKLREQEQRSRDETSSMIKEEGKAFIERITLEESLGRMDAVQKEASRKDAGNAEVPVPRDSRRER